MLERIKRLFPHEFRQQLKRRFLAVQDMQTRLANLKRAGFVPTGAIDGGAYCGDWTKTFWRVWPDTPCLMIEPQPGQFSTLTNLAQQVAGSAVQPVAISDSDRKERFLLEETNSRLGGEELECDSEAGAGVEIQVRTLDSILRDDTVFKPNLLKLDLQGFELAALDGCSACLSQFEVIVLEISILRIGDVPIFHEVDQYLSGRGYRMYDLLPTYYRPLDGALWQMDAFYVQQSSPLIASRDWD